MRRLLALCVLAAALLGCDARAAVICLTSGASWTVPADWNSTNNSIEAIGAGGYGNFNAGNGNYYEGGGGAYAKISNQPLTSNASVTYQVGAGLDSCFVNCTTLKAEKSPCGPTSCSIGGSTAGSVGTVLYAGGWGSGPTTNSALGGGGGAAGPSGAGVNAVNGTGGAGDNGTVAGGAPAVAGANGSAWTCGAGGTITGAAGAGGGGGSNGGAGGNYGGGGGSGTTTSVGGIIVITYTPRRRTMNSVF